jgi:hypothetical protein
MLIADLFKEIAARWSSYRQQRTVDKEDPVYALVTNQLPEALKNHVAPFEFISIEGSTGAGNITAAPWIALFDKRLTTSATREYYVVYLFSVDLSTVTLSLAFGTTQFEKLFGGPSDAFPRMRTAASRLQAMFRHLLPPNMELGPINLNATPKNRLHYAYQQASILSFPSYSINNLPSEAQMIDDLKRLVQLYTDIVSDPLEATVDQLLEAVVVPAAVEVVEVREFKPRPPQPTRSAGVLQKRRRAFSLESRKVGDAGEKVVLKYERERLIRNGRPELADRVRWHTRELEFPGWDITSFDDQGTEIYIEVKSSVGETFTSFGLTVNEWEAAMDVARCERYYIYLVTSALSAKPCIERLSNPAAVVRSGKISCTPAVYEICLRPEQITAVNDLPETTTQRV